MKTAEEIKKGLTICQVKSEGKKLVVCDPDECPYGPQSLKCKSELHEDAYSYIRQLEAERDAALADFKLYRERNIKGECGVYACDLCKHGGRYEDWDGMECPTGCSGVSHWQWRGVQKEEAK